MTQQNYHTEFSTADVGVPANIFLILVKKKIIYTLLTQQNYHTEFLTGTIYNWEHLLAKDDFKNIILDSFQWLVNNKKCSINAFVLMPNHIHLLWKI